MLVLGRRAAESIQIGDDIVVTIVKAGSVVKVGVDAPPEVRIVRSEIREEADCGKPIQKC